MVAQFAVLFAGVLEPFYEAVLMAVADRAGALAWMVQGSTRLRPAAADTAQILVLHGEWFMASRSCVCKFTARNVCVYAVAC